MQNEVRMSPPPPPREGDETVHQCGVLTFLHNIQGIIKVLARHDRIRRKEKVRLEELRHSVGDIKVNEPKQPEFLQVRHDPLYA